MKLPLFFSILTLLLPPLFASIPSIDVTPFASNTPSASRVGDTLNLQWTTVDANELSNALKKSFNSTSSPDFIISGSVERLQIDKRDTFTKDGTFAFKDLYGQIDFTFKIKDTHSNNFIYTTSITESISKSVHTPYQDFLKKLKERVAKRIVSMVKETITPSTVVSASDGYVLLKPAEGQSFKKGTRLKICAKCRVHSDPITGEIHECPECPIANVTVTKMVDEDGLIKARVSRYSMDIPSGAICRVEYD